MTKKIGIISDTHGYWDEKYIQSPIDQALAAVVMQAVALNFLVMIREKHTVYDRGDQWSEASKSVGYRVFFGLIKKDDVISSFISFNRLGIIG